MPKGLGRVPGPCAASRLDAKEMQVKTPLEAARIARYRWPYEAQGLSRLRLESLHYKTVDGADRPTF